MIDGQGDVALGEEAHQVVEVFFGGAARGGDDRAAGGGDLFDQDPVVHVRAGDRDDRHVEFDAEVHRCLVEGGSHGDTGEVTDLVHQAGEVIAAEAGVFGLLDVAQFGVAAILGVDEGIHLAELELDRRPDVVVADDGGMVADDLEPALDAAPVVVGQFQDEEVLEQIAIALGDGGMAI